MVVVEHRKLLKQRAFVRSFDVLFERQQTARPGNLEHLIKQAEQFEIMFLGIARPAQHGAQGARDPAQDRFRIGDDEGADRGTDDDHEFERLPQHEEVAAHSGVAAQHAGEDGDGPDEEQHVRESRCLERALGFSTVRDFR
jgi:hypothetical protein